MSERSEPATRPNREPAGRGPSTQLRLLASERPRALRARKASPRARRPVHWESQWRLDTQTRQAGRKGVATARAALARANPDELRRAS